MMADEFDRASDIEMAERDRLIEEARKQKPRVYTGFCKYCNDRLDTPMKQFCSPECRDDFELEEAAMHRHNGRC